MPQQQSLLAFYGKSTAKKERTSSDHQTTSVYTRRHKHEPQHEQPVQLPSQSKQFLRIQEKMLSRRKIAPSAEQDHADETLAYQQEAVRNACQNSAEAVAASAEDRVAFPPRPLVPGIKRIRENEHDSSTSIPTQDLEKRRKLVQALGADDGLQQRGAWAEARSKFEWMSPSRIRDGNSRRPGHPLFDEKTIHIPADVLSKLSASQKQYWITKSKYMDTVLFFKVGKFYELYEVDAEIGHKELDWKLTISGVGRCRQVGCPESGIDDAVRKLVARGYKVGRMEQIETSEEAKRKRGPGAMVQRELMEVLTPATLRDGNLQPQAIHVLALKEEICIDGKPGDKEIAFGFAFTDAAAGQFYVGSIRDNSSRSALCALLAQVVPQEVLFEIGGLSQDTRKVLQRANGPGLLPVVLSPLQPIVEFMDAPDVLQMLHKKKYFTIGNPGCQLDSDGKEHLPGTLDLLKDNPLASSSLGALVCHLCRLKSDSELLPHGLLLPYEVYKGSLRLDGQTISNLELLENMADGGKIGTLIGYLDNCSTLFGKRLLRRWICHPLQNIQEINDRLNAVDEFIDRSEWTSSIKVGLQKLPDIERLVARIRGLAGSSSLGVIPMAAARVHQRRLGPLQMKLFCATVHGIQAAYDLLKSFSDGLDDYGSLNSRILLAAGKLSEHSSAYEILSEIQSNIEGTSSAPKLRLQEGEMEVEDESFVEKEARALSRLMFLFNNESKYWMDLVEALGTVDVLIAFSIASSEETCRPQLISGVNSRSVLSIKGLWHPYATGGQGGRIVPNDVELGNPSDADSARAMLLTGPNMGGKSTLLRATCIAAILAQLGCRVPAASCIMSPIDIIFTRLGASDHIMSGESTFMVECSEAASVLQHATSNSLVVLDELGRGTSTFDGYAIAFSVLHDLVERVNCRLLFATHYHPLTTEFGGNRSVVLKHMAFTFESTNSACPKSHLGCEATSRPTVTSSAQNDRQLVFLYTLKSGACQASYGLQVSLLAGIPKTVVEAAEQAGETMHQRLSTIFDSAQSKTSTAVQLKLLGDLCSTRKIYNNPSETMSEGHRFKSLLGLWQEVKTLG